MNWKKKTSFIILKIFEVVMQWKVMHKLIADVLENTQRGHVNGPTESQFSDFWNEKGKQPWKKCKLYNKYVQSDVCFLRDLYFIQMLISGSSQII